MTDIVDLIIRLESAAEGSRELDAEIETIADLPREAWRHVLPRFSTSVDAALTLIPKHFSFDLTASAAEDFAPGSFTRCRLWDWRRGPKMSDPDNEWKSEDNRQLPLNICLAALRARQSTP